MRYKKAIQLPQSQFKRLYAVSKDTFQVMIREVAKARLGKKGSPCKLLIPDGAYKPYGAFEGANELAPQPLPNSMRSAPLCERGTAPHQILLTLQYWREYRTFFHISQDWGIHDSTASRIVKKIENILIKSEKFRLPSQRELKKNKRL
ncbi:helix-turn-helix domain-containing protein [Gloeothece verrucosa]|uniref:helix-turn-helix domain-containing protein n=1 Tax=Gloeothece verrucosa TaxID=2546359 RepID=UPI0002DB9B28|nr:transposase family protein [Gloeothece verrucosa]